MKRYNVLLRLTTCLALGGTLTTLWICAVIGFGLHTTVGKEALYLWLVLQALQLSAAALRLRRGGVVLARRLRLALRGLLCLWCGGAAALLASLGAALAGLSYGSIWVSLPCTLGTIAISAGWAGQLFCLWRGAAYSKAKEHEA